MTEVRKIYERRFGGDLEFRRAMWEVLCEEFFQRFVPMESAVVEVGAGYCEFINAIRARRRIAVDVNPSVRDFAAAGVETIVSSSVDLAAIPSGTIDVAFASNFFEHLTRVDIVATLGEVDRVLRRGGRFLVLQPNIRYCYRDYWMFFDHITPLDDRSLKEALETSGFRVVKQITRFLPYTTQGRLPKSVLLLRAYLQLRPLWRVFGAQTFVMAETAQHE
jgi:SAM-dependent methyltransferase